MRAPRLIDQDASEDTRLRLISDEDEIVHIVCCRDAEWTHGLCGTPADEINAASRVPCTMCVEVAESHCPGWLDHDPPICPIDHEPCPDEHDIDLRILRETSE